MIYTIDDVGERPGRDLLTDAEKLAIATEWNSNEAKRPAEEWQREMTKADSTILPRWAEDLINAFEASGVSMPVELTSKRDAKVALRNSLVQ